MALEVNSHLHTLQLSCNRIDDVGCKRLAQALRLNNVIHTVASHPLHIAPLSASRFLHWLLCAACCERNRASILAVFPCIGGVVCG